MIHSPIPKLTLLLLTTLGLASCDKLKTQLADILESESEAAAGADGPAAVEGELVRQVTEADYEEFIQTPGCVVVVDFYADWCGPCRQLCPVLKQIVHDNEGRILLGKVDVDQEKALASRAGVRGIPDVRIFKHGEQVDRFVGALPEPVARKRIEAQLKGLEAPAEATPEEAEESPDPEPKEPQAKPQPEPQPEPQAEPQAEPQPEPQAEEAPQKAAEEKKVTRPMPKNWLPPGMERK